MALIACQECSREVSTQATSCPHCGAPVAAAAAEARAAGARLTTVQGTSKRLKLHQLTSGLLVIIGAMLVMNATMWSPGARGGGIGGLLLLVGFAWAVITRVRMWWHHG